MMPPRWPARSPLDSRHRISPTATDSPVLLGVSQGILLHTVSRKDAEAEMVTSFTHSPFTESRSILDPQSCSRHRGLSPINSLIFLQSTFAPVSFSTLPKRAASALI
jgi:hypothetical protein